MKKALASTLALFILLTGRIVSGQFCPDLPNESTIYLDLERTLESMTPQSSRREVYTNCVAYDGTSRNYVQTTVTVQYIIGSTTISAQARYMCEAVTGMPGSYTWGIRNVMLNAGTISVQSGCINCMGASETTCTPCDSSPCGQNGEPDVYCTGCVCNAGYTGANCTTDINECATLGVCEGGGDCTNTIGSFVCTCPVPCTSPDCNACCSSPCEKGGTCSSNSSTAFLCNCPPGFTGETCRVFEGGCYSSPCMNDGDCQDTSTSSDPVAYRCSCPIGFTGVNCETRIDYCASQPCMNSGWCTSMTTGYTCTCLQGFTGRDCSQPLLTCRSNPSVCRNGVCTNRMIDDVPDTSYCSCNPGYMGETCDQVVSSCINDQAPCLHLGTCSNRNDEVGFSCNCTVGNWEGFYCTDCGLQCVNGNINAGCTRCVCNRPWIGDNCDRIQNCTSYNNNTCQSCEGNLVVEDNTCVQRANPTEDDSNTAETIGIVLGSVAGAGVVLISVFVLLYIALWYVRLSGMASMRKDDPTLVDKQQARLSGFFAPKSTLFSSGGHTGGIRTGVNSSFPSYKEMVNEAERPGEDDTQGAAFENVGAEISSPEHENPDEEWLPPPDD